jgi:hypothetical protein
MSRRREQSNHESAAAAAAANAPPGNSVNAAVRERQRAVAEREAARLARPEARRTRVLAHADRKKSAVTSTPFGVLPKNSARGHDDGGGTEEEWCGPFSVARQMIAKREEAKRKREEEEASDEHHPLDALMDQVAEEQRRKAHPSMQWKSSLKKMQNENASIYVKRQKRVDVAKDGKSRIPSLFQLCINFVVDNFEYVEAIGDVDNDVRLAISRELISRNQLDAKAFEALIEPNFMEILEVPDCAGIPQDAMALALGRIKGLRYLLLTHAGRCFGPKAVREFLEKNASAQLACISISGAYLLKDEDAASLIERHASTLQSISFKVCPMLSDRFIEALQTHVATKEILLELSLEEMTFSQEQLEMLASCTDLWKNVKSISLKSVAGLTDEILAKILMATGSSLDSLDISFNYELTDATLSTIRQCNFRLKTLVMNGVKELTAAGLEAMFTHPLLGLPPPPKLKVLQLSSVDHQAVTDEVMRLVTAGTSAQDAEDSATMPSFASNQKSAGGGLVQLDIQGSTMVTDSMLEQLVETSANTLEDLNISYCPLISDNGLGYLLAKAGQQLKNIQVWGCAQLTDDFFDGHDRVNDRTLQIEGAWMKKSGTSSLR